MLHDRAAMQENHDRFVQRVVGTQIVWGLNTGTGLASCPSHDENAGEVIMFWSDRAYAERARQQSFPECTLDTLALFDFLFRWLPGMADDGLLAGTNWTGDLAGLEVDPMALHEQILELLPAAVIDRFRDQLERELS
jgi:hypothetical protein